MTRNRDSKSKGTPAQPWLWTSRKTWVVDVVVEGRRKRVNLGRERKAAFDKWRELLKQQSLTDPGPALPAPAPAPAPPAPTPPPAPAQTNDLYLVELADNFLDDMELRLKPKALELKKDSLTRFVRRHRDRYADEITPQDINAFQQALSKGTEQTATRPLSNRTVNIHISNVRTMYNWALKQGMVTANPTAVTQKLPEGEGRTRILTPDEVDDLLGACQDPAFRDMLDIYLNTGLRSTELSSLTWADVDLENRHFTVRRVKTENIAKTTIIQHLPLNETALRAFARQPRREGHIFLNNAGKPFEQNRIGQRMRRLRVRAGLTCDVTVHVLRHTFASNLAMRGVPIQSIAVLLGHKRAETSERYTNLPEAHLYDLVNKLDEPDALEERSVGGYTAVIESQDFQLMCG